MNIKITMLDFFVHLLTVRNDFYAMRITSFELT